MISNSHKLLFDKQLQKQVKTKKVNKLWQKGRKRLSIFCKKRFRMTQFLQDHQGETSYLGDIELKHS